MDWTALSIGEFDLSFGVDYLKELESMADFPFLSANILNKEGGKPVFTPYTVVKLSGFNVGITSVIGRDILTSEKQKQMGIYVDNEFVALKGVIKELKRKSDFIIVLCPTGFERAKEIAGRFDEIDLILTGHNPVTNLYQPIKVGGTLISQIYSRGKYVGRLDIQINDSSLPYDLYLEGKSEITNFQYQKLTMRRQQLENVYKDFKKKKEEGKNVDDGLKIIKDELDDIKEKIKELEKENKKDHKNTVKASLVSLGDNLADDPEVKKIDNEYKDKLIEEKGKFQEDMLKKGKRSPTDLAQDPHYVGAKMCGTCHPSIADFVKKTRHPGAFDTLRENKRQFEPECFSCHTTGYRMPGGFTNLYTAGELIGVQCEACHGPGSRHVLDTKVNMKKTPTEKDCVTCHDIENDDNFVYSTDMKTIKCPKEKR
ncbi:MAG: hypothetical protein JW984_03475 [Deltaproteobacteria bacterium]|uniref:Cytochrome c-552/4 domain-containing protein n=1 Tax=Candidatus Zymogenus saltonus TaxID=2844893 RepID=A0A9D8KAZ4_9DELT|nr:hypothetical protein [Candidatus Zymogenus saltonus]